MVFLSLGHPTPLFAMSGSAPVWGRDSHPFKKFCIWKRADMQNERSFHWSFRMYRLQYEQRTRLVPPDGGRRIEYARRSYFRRSLSRAPRYVCERGSRTLAGRHGKCAASHRPPPARLFASSDGTDSFCENVSEFFPTHSPKLYPKLQQAAASSVLSGEIY